MKKSIGDYIHIYKQQYWEILAIIIVIISWFILYDFWINLINVVWVKPVMDKLSDDLDLSCALLIISIILYYSIVIKYEKVRNPKRFWIIFCITAIYLRCFFSNQWSYYSVINGNQWLCYAHIIVLPVLGEILFFIIVHEKKKEEVPYDGLEYPTPLESYDENDSYMRNGYVKSIVNLLKKSFHEKGSFAVGVVGAWGTGKTSFTDALKGSLKKDVDIIIEFNPWYCKSPEDILQDFFASYRDKISFFASTLSPKLQRYVETLLENDDSGILKSFRLLFNTSNKKTTQDSYHEINSILAKAQIRVLVIIDDLDRLNNNEVTEILRLIRNTANFPFTQFIVSYDKNYVTNALENSNIANASQYLNKIFNLEISLPKFEERIICEELYSRISSYLKKIKIGESLGIRGMIYLDQNEDEDHEDVSYIMPQILSNIRDVIRFTNSFKINLQPFVDSKLIDEIEIRDFYFLELIRYGFPEVYHILRNNPLRILDVDFTSKKYTYKVKLKEDEAQASEEKLLDEILDEKNRIYKHIVSPLLRDLFAYNQNDYYSHNIWHLRSYGKYFSYRIDPQTLTFAEILSVMDDSNALPKIEDWVKNKKWGELEDKLSLCFDSLEPQETTYEVNGKVEFRKESKLPYEKVYAFVKLLLSSKYRVIREETLRATSHYINNFDVHSRSQLKAVIELWMHISKQFNDDAYNRIDNENILMALLYKNNLALKLHDPIDDSDSEIVKELLIKTECPEIISPLINQIILSQSADLNEENMTLSIQALKEIQIEYLNNYITQYTEINEICLKLFHCCIESIDPQTNKAILAPKALTMMYNFIKLYPQGYILLFIRPGETSHEQFNTIFPEPTWKRLFESAENFEKFLFDQKLDSCDKIECVRNYWQLYKHNQYKPIEFDNQGVVTEIINSNFVEETEKLNKLIQIDKEVEEFVHDIRDGKYTKDNAYKRLNEIENKFQIINLYIALNGKIRTQIDDLKKDIEKSLPM